jgi:hypothetical protein
LNEYKPPSKPKVTMLLRESLKLRDSGTRLSAKPSTLKPSWLLTEVVVRMELHSQMGLEAQTHPTRIASKISVGD